MQITKTYTTSLETTDNVAETMEWKISSLAEDGEVTDVQVADYLALSIGNLERLKAFMKQTVKETNTKAKKIEKHIDLIKTDGAKYLIDNGLIDPNSDKTKDRKIAGANYCSSISVSKEKPSVSTTTTKKEFVMNITQDELEELLIGLGKAEYKEVEIEKKSNMIPSKIRVNHEKALSVTVE